MRKIIILVILYFLCYHSIAQDEDFGDANRAQRANGKFKVTKMDNRATNFITFWDEDTQEFTAYDGNFFDTGYISSTDSSILLLCNTQSGYCISIKMSQQLQSGLSDTLYVRRQFNPVYRQLGTGATDSFVTRQVRFSVGSVTASGIRYRMVDAHTLEESSTNSSLGATAKTTFDWSGTAGSGNGDAVFEQRFNKNGVVYYANSARALIHAGLRIGDTSIAYNNTNFPKISNLSIFNQADVFWHPVVIESSTGGLPNSGLRRYEHTKGRNVNITRVTSSTYTTTANDEIIYADAASNSVTITLMGLGAGGVNNLQYTIKRIDSNASNTVIVNPPNANWRIDRYRQLKLDTSSSIVLVGRNFGTEYTSGSTAYAYKIDSWYKSSQNTGVVYNQGEGEKIAGFDIKWLLGLLVFGLGIGIGQKTNFNKDATNKV